ncbi:MAG: efflux RND transporter permease subunit [Acidobacteriota bacterium]
MIRSIIASPRLVLVVVMLVSLVAGFGLRQGLTLDASAFTFIEHEGPAMDEFNRARRHFGSDDYLIIAVADADIFAPPTLQRLRQLHQQIARMEGVVEVVSLSNVPYARSLPEGASLEMLLPADLGDGERIAEARRIAAQDRLYSGNVVSADGQTAALNVRFSGELDSVRRTALSQRIYDASRGAGFQQVWFAGDPFTQLRAVGAIRRDLTIFLPLTILMIAGLLWRSFRSVRAVVLPLLTIGIGLLWLLGLMAALRAHFTILALMLPTLMLAIGCSYMIHVVNQIGLVATVRTGISKVAIVEEAVRFIALPVIVSALTIIAGFLSLSFTNIPAIRETSIYAAIGAAITMLLSLSFLPACLVLWPGEKVNFRVGLGGASVRQLETIGRWATTRQTLLYIITGVIVIVSVIGIWRIVIDIDYFHFFKPNSETTIGLDQINRRLSGAVTFSLVVETARPDGIVDPEVLRRIATLQRQVETYRDPGGRGVDLTLSAADLLRHVHQAFNRHDPAAGDLPTDPALLDDLLADRAQLRGLLSSDGSAARILVRSNLSGSQSMATAIREIEREGRAIFPEFRVYATGTMVLLNRTSDSIAREQVFSVTLALVTIFLMLVILFRSFRVGLTALIPNLIPILFFFGFMGWIGIPLNLTTSLVASVVLGLAVDNAVQFVVRFRRLLREQETVTEAIVHSLRYSGRPIIYANVALAATFTIFALSNFEPIGSFGLLSAVTILGCLIEDLVLLPARLTSPIFRS